MRRLPLSVHHVPPERATEEVAVVIDVLRWTTTSIIALSNGAAGIEAFATPEAARIRAQEIGALTAGERNAHRIPGFDLGNSPTEFTRERVQGRVICATTTNGTNALLAAQGAAQVFLAAFVNLSATAQAIRALAPRGVEIICAGSEGKPSPEDSACGEALAALLRGEPCEVSPLSVFRRAPHAAHLMAQGYTRDVELAAALDSIPLVAVCRDGRVEADVAGGEM
ncbi:2-phosphosulfolactate phosphatase [Pseudogemmatithrix spongiicola]|uniref:Probable 2-phosphosulfolactate phosphatase n=1 Tax=Pseudogemmatithrix spongiicola TaxID=3062599 RepID=A0AA49K024_9BACT|nr:2-phosphosulfolactate phosphatase [Gemmatimonadaceae bacterium 'strain 138']WKW15400.1 2-phosphosulfolactate phosphatase [Gemmatimonadaceae bacterium 'strain 318']